MCSLSDLTNYRGTTLTSVILKVFEHCLLQKFDYLNKIPLNYKTICFQQEQQLSISNFCVTSVVFSTLWKKKFSLRMEAVTSCDDVM